MNPFPVILTNTTKRIEQVTERTLKRLVQTNYYTTKAYHHYSFAREERRYNKSPLLIYQMGKVGSTTVVKSLQPLIFDRPIYHLHFLSQEYIDRNEEKNKTNFNHSKFSIDKHFWQSQYIRRKIDRGLEDKMEIVTLVREPIARNISAFFQNLKVEPSEYDDRYNIISSYGFEVTLAIDETEKLMELFLERFDHDTPLVFFDREVKSVFGLDVFASKFPLPKGYEIYRGEQVDLLLIRLENLNECARDAFGEFLNIDGLILLQGNIGKKKDYADFYQRMLETISLPDAYIEEMYRSKYMRHFYSEAEINTFRKKWSR